ncbi:hypothetical protein D3C85_1294350 [compost metagenome]
MRRDATQYRLRALVVSKPDIVKAQVTRARWQFARVLGLGYLGRLTLQLHHPAEADCHALERHIQAKQALHRTYGHAEIGGKGDQRAQLPRALYHPVAADDKGAGTRQ